MPNANPLGDVNVSDYTTMNMQMRKKILTSYGNGWDDVTKSRQDYPNVDFRYLIEPSFPLPSGIVPIAFNKTQMAEMMQMGYDDAVRAVNNPTDSDVILAKHKAMKAQNRHRVRGNN